MRERKLGLWLWLLVWALWLGACRGPMAAPPIATPTAAAPPPASPVATEAPGSRPTPTAAPTEGGALQPPSAERCEAMRSLVSDVVGVEATVAPGPFEDYVQGNQGEGCTVEASAPAASFPSFGDVALALTSALEAQGFTQDFMYVADGPTGTGSAFRVVEEGLLCLLQVSQEAEGAPSVVRLPCAVSRPPD